MHSLSKNMGKKVTYIRCALFIYLALHFVFNGAFLHNHVIDGESISHAHPFKSNDHNPDEARTILLFNTTAGIAQEETALPLLYTNVISVIDFKIIDNYTDALLTDNSSRAPPYFC